MLYSENEFHNHSLSAGMQNSVFPCLLKEQSRKFLSWIQNIEFFPFGCMRKAEEKGLSIEFVHLFNNMVVEWKQRLIIVRLFIL